MFTRRVASHLLAMIKKDLYNHTCFYMVKQTRVVWEGYARTRSYFSCFYNFFFASSRCIVLDVLLLLLLLPWLSCAYCWWWDGAARGSGSPVVFFFPPPSTMTLQDVVEGQPRFVFKGETLPRGSSFFFFFSRCAWKNAIRILIHKRANPTKRNSRTRDW